MTPLDLDLDAGLRALGYAAFRPGQRESIETLLTVRRLLLVAPTGGGKSLTYQLPATLLPGTTVVVSPLIALMADQVRALEERGVAATYLASTLDGEEGRQRFAALGAGRYRIVYVAPERLGLSGFRRLLQGLRCPLLAIDEAHCISEWGHDFRPDYLTLGPLIRELRPDRVLACTATATPVVRDEILARLGLSADTPQHIHGFARPNLALRAREIGGPREGRALVDAALAEAIGFPTAGARKGGERRGAASARAARVPAGPPPGARARAGVAAGDPGGSGAARDGNGSAIIYAPTRRRAEQEAERLEERGARVAVYHAGLPPDERQRAQEGFSSGAIDVVVATNAFGMGIDRGDVRAVVHLAPPSSIEAYYQEVGRAGRDGAPALGLLLCSAQDLPLRRRLIERGGVDGTAPPAEIVEHKWQLFLELVRFIDGGSCRHDAILRYFGDEAEELGGCGRCDVCLAPEDADSSSPEERTLAVRKALSGVARVAGRYGLGLAAKLLVGQRDAKLERAGLTAVKTFGALAGWSEARVVRLLRRCVTAGLVDFEGDLHPVVTLTASGAATMRGDRPVTLLLPPEPRAARSEEPVAARRRGRSPERDQPSALFDALRAHRLERAREDGVPPYVVASDRTLRDLAERRPRNRAQLLEVHGIGPAKAERFGDGFLAVVAEH